MCKNVADWIMESFEIKRPTQKVIKNDPFLVIFGDEDFNIH
jgi:hypothetical protein